jgi:hypothetical protein
MDNKQGKLLRTIAIILMGATAAMNILGGIGTVCAAFLTRDFPMLWSLYEYRWLYQIVMIVTIIIGIAGAWLTITLSRGKKNTYRNSLILLVLGTIAAGTQVYASMSLRGKAVPANFKLYANALTLIVFLVFLIPKLRSLVGFDNEDTSPSAGVSGGLAAIIVGLIVLSTQIWVGSSHTFDGHNWVEVLSTPLIVAGIVLTLLGVGTFLRLLLRRMGTSLLSAPKAPVAQSKLSIR